MADDWDRAWRGELNDGWRDALPSFEAGEEIATRSAGQKVMAAFGEFAPTMIGGAADLVESTKTIFEGAGEFSKVHAGRNVPFGIREHAMGAIVNGLAAHGGMVSPYGSTFLMFSDYMRGSVRLSALMNLPVVWVWTHDSVGLGEDGPTHQPIEHFASLRAIPNLWVIRPGDANETSVAWRLALQRSDGPVALLFSRQNVVVIDRSDGVTTAEDSEQGGYVLWDSQTDREPDLILIATGAEVPPTLAAGRQLAAEGVATRVVSMPCVELFEAQEGQLSPAGNPHHRESPVGDRAGSDAGLVEMGRRPRRRVRTRSLRRLSARDDRPREIRIHQRRHRVPRAGPAHAYRGRLGHGASRQPRRCSDSPPSGRACGSTFSRATPFAAGISSS